MEPELPWEVYIVLTESGKLYTGIARDAERRFREHSRRGRGDGAKFFRTSRPAKIVFRERHPSRSAATIRETAIKRLTRAAKWELIGTLPRPGHPTT